MQLTQLKLTNFRCYKDETTIDLDNLVVFVGKNDSGKSSIFDALNIFFEGKTTPDSDDKCVYVYDSHTSFQQFIAKFCFAKLWDLSL